VDAAALLAALAAFPPPISLRNLGRVDAHAHSCYCRSCRRCNCAVVLAGAAAFRAAGTLPRNWPCCAGRCPASVTRFCSSTLSAGAAPRAARAASCTSDAASCAAVTAPLPRKKSRFNRGCRCARLPTSGWLRHLADALASVGCVISQVRSPSRQPGGCVTSCSCSADAAASRAAGTLLRNCPCSAGRCPISFTRCCHRAVSCLCSSSPPKEISVQSREQVRAPSGSGWLHHLAGALASVGCVISQVHLPYRQPGGCFASRSCSVNAAASRAAGTLLRNCPRSVPADSARVPRAAKPTPPATDSPAAQVSGLVAVRATVIGLAKVGLAWSPGHRLGQRHLYRLRSSRRRQSMRRLALLPHARELREAHRRRKLPVPSLVRAPHVVHAALPLPAVRAAPCAAVAVLRTAVAAPLLRKKSRFNRGCRCARPSAPVDCVTSQMRSPQ
jgi:hypothetical protein